MSVLLSYWESFAPPDHAFYVDLNDQILKTWSRPHIHEYAEIIYVKAGEGRHRINGSQSRIASGDLILLRPYLDRHCIPEDGNDLLLCHVIFQPLCLFFSMRGCFKSNESFWGHRIAPGRAIPLSHRQRRWLESTMHELSGVPATARHIERFVLDLLNELGIYDIGGEENFVPAWLLRACQAVASPEHFPQGARALPGVAHHSREHVARVCRRTLGISPTQIVNRARLNYAAGQLAHTDRNILEICLDCGFDSLCHFYGLFKRQYGLTPRQFRMVYYNSYLSEIADHAAGEEALAVRANR